MKTLLAIPSKGRPYDIQKTILKWINDINTDYAVFVEPEDYIHYKLFIDKQHLVKLPLNGQGIGYSMQQIGKYATEKGYDLVCRIDDDCGGFISKYFSNGKSGYSALIFDSAIRDIEPDFQDVKLAAVRFLDPKNHIYEAIGKARKYVYKNCELFHGWIIRTKLLEHLNENIKHNDDTALYLYSLRDGYYTLLYGRIGVQFKDGTNAGGFQMLDRESLTTTTYEYLKKDFPFLNIKPIDRWYKIDLDVSKYYCRVTL